MTKARREPNPFTKKNLLRVAKNARGCWLWTLADRPFEGQTWCELANAMATAGRRPGFSGLDRARVLESLAHYEGL